MRTRILIVLAAFSSLGLLWGCGDSGDDGGAAGTTGGSTGGAAGQAGAAGEAGQAGNATGGAAGTAGEAGAAGTAGASGEAGAAGAAGSSCGTSTAPASHTECMTAGGTSAGHLPGKDKAKTACVSCHTADLGKAAKDNCWACHDPASQTNLHDKSIAGKKHKLATSGGKGASNPECAACHLDPNSLGGNTCNGCH